MSRINSTHTYRFGIILLVCLCLLSSLGVVAFAYDSRGGWLKLSNVFESKSVAAHVAGVSPTDPRKAYSHGAGVMPLVAQSSSPQALFVVGSLTLIAGDTAIKSRLETLGFSVMVKDAPNSAAADATGKSVVVISESVAATDVGAKFRDVTVPVMVMEPGIYDDMMMTGPTLGTDYENAAGQTQLLITDSSHPMAAGLTGTVTVTTTAKPFAWGKPGAGAAKVAALATNTSRYALFGYESGASMVGMNAPARRAAVFLWGDTATFLNASGWQLFDAAVYWDTSITPPVANAGGPYYATAATNIQFDGSSSYDSDGTIVSYSWDFGDGQSGTGINPSHAYAASGLYNVTLTVTDNVGGTSRATASVSISNQAPVANAGGPYSGPVNASIQFNGAASTDSDGTIVNYRWDFGDGGDISTAEGSTPTHTYVNGGYYTATLTVTDNQGAIASTIFGVRVGQTPPTGGGNNIVGEDVKWDDGNYQSARDAENDRGRPSNHSEGNNNFQLIAPIVSLPGRGLNLNLNLYYNSLVWNKSGNDMAFDIDQDWPAPGWQLGFGKMIDMGQSGAMIIEPDGTRHGFSGTVAPFQTGDPIKPTATFFKGNTTDGSFIEYRLNSSFYPVGVARHPDGSVVYYSNYSNVASRQYLYASDIHDANGNSMHIQYDWDVKEPRIKRVVDSLGRIINFHYDGNKLLTAITAAGIKDASGAVNTRTLVRLHYKQLPLGYAFGSRTVRIRNATPWVIDAIYYPSTKTGYWFGDGDSYSSYGMIRRVSERRGMSFSTVSSDPAISLTEQGTVTAGTMSRQQDYDYPATASSSLTSAPTYKTLTETWDGMTTPPTVTTYQIENPAAPADRKVTVTRPDKTKSIQYAYNFSNLAEGNLEKLKTGLIYREELRDESDALLQKTVTTWEVAANKVPRVTRTEVTDERGQTLATAYQEYNDYNGAARVLQYDYSGSVLRTTRYAYISYTDADLDTKTNAVTPRRINLVTSEKVYDGDAAANKLARLTEYKYDEYATPLQSYPGNVFATVDLGIRGVIDPANVGPGILFHSARFSSLPPTSASGGMGSDYITKRGNVTGIVKYADLSNPAAPASPVTETMTYDMSGNLIASSSTCCEQTSYFYDEVTQYAYPNSKTRGAVADTSLLRVTTGIEYDFNTGLPLSATDSDGNKTVNVYDLASWRIKETVQPTGARTTHDYDDAGLKVTETALIALNGAVSGKVVKTLDGRGQVRQQAVTNALGTTDVVDTEYDAMGRALRQTRPYRGSETKWWAETVYDAAGRVTDSKAPYDGPASSEAADRSVTKTFYNEATRPAGASAEPGQTTRAVDAWGRWRWTRLDARGKLVEVVEQNPDGGSGLVTRYTYDVLGNLTGVQQDTQSRRFRYDAVGRLTHQKLAETEATLNSVGEVATSEPADERWSDVYKYDERSNIVSHTDARGVRTSYDYGGDPLNRLQNVTYDTSRVKASIPAVEAAPSVHFTYRAKTSASQTRDVTRVETVTTRYPGETQDFTTESYSYDAFGRVEKKALAFAGRSPFELTFSYDTLGRVKGLTYPAQYASGVMNPARKSVEYSFDAAGRVSGVLVNGAGLASQLAYGSDGQLTTLSLGAGATQLNETYQYDPKSGLLVTQDAKYAANQQLPVLLKLSYEYQLSYSLNPYGFPSDIDRKAYTGQVTRITSSTAGYVENFSYDTLGRLKQLREDQIQYCIEGCGGVLPRSDIWTQGYSYDRFGNRTSTTKSVTPSDPWVTELDGRKNGVAYTYDVNTNRLTNTGFAYDPAGNLTQDGNKTYIYDAANRLSKVKDQNGVTIESYAYGPSNQRLVTYYGDRGAARKTYYIWNGGSVVAEYSETDASPTSPQWSKNYVYMGGRLLSSQEPGTSGGEYVRYYHPDHRGTQMVTNASDTSYILQRTLPFGTALSSESVGVPVGPRFTSYDRSATTGLDYAVNRYYDPSMGRFTQVDPAGMRAADLSSPQTLNMYAYCGNDPVNHTDPDGRFFGALLSFVGNFFAGLFHNLSPHQINGSFTYHNLPPISVSFTSNLQNVSAGFGYLQINLRTQGPTEFGALSQENYKALENAFWGLFNRLQNGDYSGSCGRNVIDRLKGNGFDPSAFVRYLAGGYDFYDGRYSNAPAAGLILPRQASNALWGFGATVASIFAPTRGANGQIIGATTAVTSRTSSTFLMFLNPDPIVGSRSPTGVDLSNGGVNGRNMAWIFHEALHGFGAILRPENFDDQTLMGIFYPVAGSAPTGSSADITTYIQQNCF